jgi:hypothetical protein
MKILRESMFVDTPNDPRDGLQDVLYEFYHAYEHDGELDRAAYEIGSRCAILDVAHGEGYEAFEEVKGALEGFGGEEVAHAFEDEYDRFNEGFEDETL